jgi:hypothetical protein
MLNQMDRSKFILSNPGPIPIRIEIGPELTRTTSTAHIFLPPQGVVQVDLELPAGSRPRPAQKPRAPRRQRTRAKKNYKLGTPEYTREKERLDAELDELHQQRTLAREQRFGTGRTRSPSPGVTRAVRTDGR